MGYETRSTARTNRRFVAVCRQRASRACEVRGDSSRQTRTLSPLATELAGLSLEPRHSAPRLTSPPTQSRRKWPDLAAKAATRQGHPQSYLSLQIDTLSASLLRAVRYLAKMATLLTRSERVPDLSRPQGTHTKAPIVGRWPLHSQQLLTSPCENRFGVMLPALVYHAPTALPFKSTAVSRRPRGRKVTRPQPGTRTGKCPVIPRHVSFGD